MIAALDQHQPNYVVNCVAIIGINICEEQPLRAFELNAVVPMRIAMACAERDICVVQPSSHAVFDGTKPDYYTESDPPNPINVYGQSKAVGEWFAQQYCPRHYVVRFPTMFGPRRNASPGFADKMMQLLLDGKPLRVPDDKLDSLTYTIDVARCLVKVLRQQQPFGVYHLANAGKASYFEFICKMAELLKKAGMLSTEPQIERVSDADFPSLGQKPLKTALSSNILRPLRGWEEALAEYIAGLASA